MSSIKKLASDTVVYGFSTILVRFLNYLLVPLHTSLFLPNQLAPLVQMYVYTSVAYFLYSLGLDTALFRFASRENKRQEYYNLILSVILVMSLGCSTAIYLFSEQLAEFIKYPEAGSLIRIFSIVMALQGIAIVPCAKLRLDGRGRRFAIISLVNAFSTIFFNLFFLIFCRDVMAGKYLGFLRPLVDTFYSPDMAPEYIAISQVFSGALFLFLLRKEFAHFRFVFDWKIFKPVWIYALPILIVNIAGVLNIVYDRAIMMFLLPTNFYPGRTTAEAVGIYAVCSQLSGFMNMAIQAFKYAAEPFVFFKAEDPNAPETFARVMKYFIIVCSIIWVAVSINLDIFAALFLRQAIYHEGLIIIPWQLAGFLFLGIYYNLTTWFKLSDKTQFGTYFALAGIVVTLIASYFLVPRFGYLGFASAFALSGLIMMTLCYLVGQKYYYIPYQIKSAAFYICFAAIIIYITQLFPVKNLAVSAVIHVAIVCLLILITFAIERRDLASMVTKQKRNQPDPFYTH